MSDDLQGMVRAVVTTPLGGVATSWTGNTLVVAEASDFPRDGGLFTIEGQTDIYSYTSVVDGGTEDDPDILTTVEAPPPGLGTDELRILLHPPGVTSVAEVALPESVEDTVPAAIPHALKAWLPDGVRAPEDQEAVIIGQRDLTWQVVDILGQQEVVMDDLVTSVDGAMTSANGRNSRVTSTSEPSGSVNPNTGQAWVDGDTWRRWNNTTERHVIGAWVRRAGDWAPELITDAVITSLDVNKLVVTGSARISQLVADKIMADVAHFGSLNFKEATGLKLSVPEIKMGTTGARLEFDTGGLRAYNSAGQLTTTIQGESGSFDGATFTGGLYRTSTGSDRIQIDTAENGRLQAIRSGVTRLKMTPVDGLEFFTQSGSLSAQFLGDTAGALITGPTVRVGFRTGGAVQIDGPSSVVISGGASNTSISLSGGGIYQKSTWQEFTMYGVSAGYDTWQIRPASSGPTDHAGLQFAGGTSKMLSTTAAANVHMNAAGFVMFTTSSRRAKRDIRDIGVDPYRLLDVPVRDWLDAAALADDPTYTLRTPGVVAEEVEDAGLGQFVTYDEDGQTSGVQYDRLTLLLIPIVRELKARMDILEGRP